MTALNLEAIQDCERERNLVKLTPIRLLLILSYIHIFEGIVTAFGSSAKSLTRY